ncbi:hypothetical protein [Corynebacterium sp. sy039]|uniref:hypothetical protein n=1 Tax=Corynebacterium sp. sy039 TaxID=2599641 RepID=UPI0011B6FB61|nr:hypothetical protein [Corynebacterium sp. sy039]QDZ42431.1 hypothetical protein FQV43_04095 [Corynebacterium sp. sy039]
MKYAFIAVAVAICATVAWMMIANIGIRGGANPAEDTTAGMISQGAAVALFTLPLVVFVFIQLFLTEEQDNDIWGLMRARNGKVGQLLALRLGVCFLWLVLWAVGYSLALAVLVGVYYSWADSVWCAYIFVAMLISIIFSESLISVVHMRWGGLVPAVIVGIVLSVIGVSLIGQTSVLVGVLPTGALLAGNPFRDVAVGQPLLGFEPNPTCVLGLGVSAMSAVIVCILLFSFLRIRVGKA